MNTLERMTIRAKEPVSDHHPYKERISPGGILNSGREHSQLRVYVSHLKN